MAVRPERIVYIWKVPMPGRTPVRSASLDDRGDQAVSDDRIRGLLAATRAVTENLALPQVLTQIVHSARDLIGSSYAALGVLGLSLIHI